MNSCPGVLTSEQYNTGHVLVCDQAWVIGEPFLTLADVGELSSAILLLFAVAFAFRFCFRFLLNR